ncbi:FAD-dependent thymidylate synthase [Serpentinicella sp. ANB-PHB4]|uniref:FAD-dependent thymidylate synthase n=1 Tax=Serpentinicella sp. ANB-PHB4 TaxID=3074076 RepID=UPI0028621367|nr:FAD-dependent thymidylate synthase [Serpentinicella sp. ANB-PHB4]MDR5659929.1 FAD-dependent thymidylate synthase [Serpentinicella sp. ANB-PHB4]
METSLNVSLIQHTPEPEKLVGSAARLCYASSNIAKIMDSIDGDQNSKFINMLAEMGHESPFEHINFTFAIEGVSRSLTHQLVRHRIGSSYSQQSQRYVKEGAFEYIIPPEIKNDPRAKKVYVEAMMKQQEAYDEITNLLTTRYYNKNITQGIPEKKAKSLAEKKAIEDARFVLPNACETKIIVTMNARALFNFFHHRCCSRAQWEIRELATEMLRQVRAVAPSIFGKSGPNCLTSSCPEGNMTCGSINEVREKFRSLQ